MGNFRNWSVAVGMFLLLVSLWLLFYAIPSQVPASRREEISPRFYPQLGAVVLGSLSLMLLFQEWQRRKSKAAPYAFKRLGRGDWQLLGVAATLLAFGWTVSPIGFYIVSPLVMIGLYVWLGLRSWAHIIGISIGCLLFIYFLFEKGLQVELPRGLFQQ